MQKLIHKPGKYIHNQDKDTSLRSDHTAQYIYEQKTSLAQK